MRGISTGRYSISAATVGSADAPLQQFIIECLGTVSLQFSFCCFLKILVTLACVSDSKRSGPPAQQAGNANLGHQGSWLSNELKYKHICHLINLSECLWIEGTWAVDLHLDAAHTWRAFPLSSPLPPLPSPLLPLPAPSPPPFSPAVRTSVQCVCISVHLALTV